MTPEEYAQRVQDTAATFLTENDAREWKVENEEDFSAYYHDSGEYGQHDNMHTLIDSSCAQGWREAIEVLLLTDQDPDHVDSGLHEGCGWQQTLVVLAFDCFQGDVFAKASEMYDNDEFPDYVVSIPTNQRQIGYGPERVGYKIAKDPWVINLHDGVKIYREDIDLVVVFEGEVEERPSRFIVQAKRVYTMGGDDSNIEAELERCREELGVRRIGA